MASKCHNNSDFMLTINTYVCIYNFIKTYVYIAFTLSPQLDCIYITILFAWKFSFLTDVEGKSENIIRLTA